MYRNLTDYELMKAGHIEACRLSLYDRAYIRMHRKWFDIDGPSLTPAEKKKRLAEIRAKLIREVDEYTASEAFDPVLAKQLRKKLRQALKEKLNKGITWSSRFEKMTNEEAK